MLELAVEFELPVELQRVAFELVVASGLPVECQRIALELSVERLFVAMTYCRAYLTLIARYYYQFAA